jgi:glutaredoxin
MASKITEPVVKPTESVVEPTEKVVEQTKQIDESTGPLTQLPTPDMIPGIVVYGAPWCTVCTQCKNYLFAEELRHTYINFEEFTTKEEFFKTMSKFNQGYTVLGEFSEGYSKIPQVYYYGEFIGGFNDTKLFVKMVRHFCHSFSKRMAEQLQNHLDLTAEYNDELSQEDLERYTKFIKCMRK